MSTRSTFSKKTSSFPNVRQKCFLICNAHLDPVWLWTWEEGLTEAISTYRVAADFCDQYPDFVFNHNESLLYEWVERNDPELFRRIRKHVRKGRWHIAGGAFLQPDLVAASGESVIRHFLVGKEYFRKKFRKDPTTAYNFDTFGHPQGLVQILKGCGMDSYIFCRPNAAAMELPVGSFRWRHASGAEIVARRSDDHYVTQGSLLKNLREGHWEDHYREEGDFLFLWGLGNHGGGPSHAEYADLQKLSGLFPRLDFVESTPEQFFAHTIKTRGRKNLPVVKGDFKPCMEGCYTSMQDLKMQHRRVENLMAAVETYASMAWWRKCREYPSKDLHVAWKDLLFSEFHDLVTGSGIEKVEQDGHTLLGHAEEILRRRRAELLIALLRNEPLAERNETPIFVFNPHPWEVTQEVEIDFGIDRQFCPDGVVRRLLQDGVETEAQFEKADENLWNLQWGEWRSRAVFLTTIPPLGYKRFDSDYTPMAPENIRRWKSPALPKRGNLTLKTDFLEVTINIRTGLLDRVVCEGRLVIDKQSCQSQIFSDLNHSWITPGQWCDPIARFKLASPEQAMAIIGSAHTHRSFAQGKPPISILEDGPTRIIVEAIFVHGASYIAQRYVINRKRPVIHVEQTIFWTEHDRMLRLSLRHDDQLHRIQAEKCYSIDDDTQASERGGEMDFQHFLRVSGDEGAFGVVSHGTHSYCRQPGELRLGILRSPTYATHEENIGPDCDRYLNRYMPRQDQGIRKAKFSLFFGPSAASTQIAVRTARECNVPLDPFVYFPTRRCTPTKGNTFARTSATNVLVVTLKKAEDSDALVIRLWETGGKKTRFRLTIEERSYPLSINAWQLKTFRLSRDGELVECNLIER